MKQTRYTILDEPTGETYRDLLRYSLNFCDTFLLVVRRSIQVAATAQEVLDRLTAFQLSRTEESEWPGTQLLDESATVYRFKWCDESFALLERFSKGLFSWKQPELPEDLCLIRTDGSPWLVIIAHERDSYLELSADEKIDLVAHLPGIKLGGL